MDVGRTARGRTRMTTALAGALTPPSAGFQPSCCGVCCFFVLQACIAAPRLNSLPCQLSKPCMPLSAPGAAEALQKTGVRYTWPAMDGLPAGLAPQAALSGVAAGEEAGVAGLKLL